MDKVDTEFAQRIRGKCDALILEQANIRAQVDDYLRQYEGKIDKTLEMILKQYQQRAMQSLEIVSLWAQLDMVLNYDKKSDAERTAS